MLHHQVLNINRMNTMTLHKLIDRGYNYIHTSRRHGIIVCWVEETLRHDLTESIFKVFSAEVNSPQRSVNLSFTITNVKNDSMNLFGN